MEIRRLSHSLKTVPARTLFKFIANLQSLGSNLANLSLLSPAFINTIVFSLARYRPIRNFALLSRIKDNVRFLRATLWRVIRVNPHHTRSQTLKFGERRKILRGCRFPFAFFLFFSFLFFLFDARQKIKHGATRGENKNDWASRGFLTFIFT